MNDLTKGSTTDSITDCTRASKPERERAAMVVLTLAQQALVLLGVRQAY